MNNTNNSNEKYIKPFYPMCCINEFPFLDYTFDKVTDWQIIQLLGEKLNEVIKTTNNTSEIVTELKNYVNNYFNNLDVQQEINNKLDEMVEKGTLQEIISIYLKSFISENLVETSKNINGTTLYFLKIPFLNQNNERNTIKIGIANDNDVPNTFEDPLIFSFRKNATAVINGGLWDTDNGILLGNNLMINGEDLQSVPTNDFYTLGIKNDGTLTAYSPQTTKEEILADNCENTVGGYFPIIQNGTYPSQEIINLIGDSWNSTKYPRSAIAQTSDNTIYFVSCSGKNVDNQQGITYKELADALLSLQDNVIFAYALDGGSSSCLIHRGHMLNSPTQDDGRSNRNIKSFIYISNNINSQHDEDINYLNYMSGRNRRSIDNMRASIPYNYQIKNGFLDLLNPENVTYEGINVYENGKQITKLNTEEKRLAYFNYLREIAIVDFNADLDRWVFNGKNMANIYQQANTEEVTDLNNLTNTGFYFASSEETVLNKPTSTRAYHIINIASQNGTYIHQIALPFVEEENIFYRFKRTEGWDEWKQIQFVS